MWKLLVVEAWQEHGLELEPFRTVIGEKVHADGTLAARIEAAPQLGSELRKRPLTVIELLGEPHEAAQVCLPRLLAFAQLVGDGDQPARVLGQRANALCHVGRMDVHDESQEPTCRLTREQGRTLERQSGLMQHFFEVGQPGVRAAENGDLLERHPFAGDPFPPPQRETRVPFPA